MQAKDTEGILMKHAVAPAHTDTRVDTTAEPVEVRQRVENWKGKEQKYVQRVCLAHPD